jgi:hypothetical protein
MRIEGAKCQCLWQQWPAVLYQSSNVGTCLESKAVYWDCPGNEVSCSCFDEQVIACGEEIY